LDGLGLIILKVSVAALEKAMFLMKEKYVARECLWIVLLLIGGKKIDNII